METRRGMKYEPQVIEKKWQSWWQEQGVYRVSADPSRPKYYVLDMFPYPSGAGLHVGHPLGYISSDIYSRFKRMCGYNVLHPMGFDAFGLPAEQYAIQMGVHPATSTSENIARYRSQLDNIGFSYDWDREVRTCDPAYYKWTQWIFLQLYDHYYDTALQRALPVSDLVSHLAQNGTEGLQAACSEPLTLSAAEWAALSPVQQDEVLMNYRLAYRKMTYVNWCEALGTVLANDEVKDGLSERGGHPVEQRPMLQWSLRITAYAGRLLEGLETLEWTESMKKMQRNWIGRSEGARVFFQLENANEAIEIFTTRPDTIFGATFMVLAPEHELVDRITTSSQREAVEAYREFVQTRSERQRMSEVDRVSGAFTGAMAINPLSNKPVPVWISEYVLKDYGTGAIMAVPARDDRDHRFATHFGLPIVEVIDQSANPEAGREEKTGVMINSGFLDGLTVQEAIVKATETLITMGIGQRQVNYRLRDAIYSRQRYWGEPFPIVYDPEGVSHPMNEQDLPLELPPLSNFQPASGGQSPLARATNWVQLENGWTRETDTMPGFAGSSWYFLRYMDPTNDQAFAGSEALNYWKDVDLYIGGTEHAVGHLMYARFWHKFLYDKGLVPTDEPFRKLINQGMIQGVIEYIYLDKEKHEDGRSRFVCARLAEQEMTEGKEFVRIPIHIDFVRDYGTSASFIDGESIQAFTKWRSEYQDATFECSAGRFSSSGSPSDIRLYTSSEVGKMSKRYFNVVNPDDVVRTYGADCFRMYEMFLGPIDQAKPWDTKGIDGVSKFLRRLWSLFIDDKGQWLVNDEEPDREMLKILHTAIKRVREDLERFSLNTCISHFMICVNELKKKNAHQSAILEPLLLLLAPFAPHISEELWHRLGHEGSIHAIGQYPVEDEQWLVEDVISYPISINGKKRAVVEFPASADKETLEREALENEVVKKWIEGMTVRKVIVVPGRMINLVVG